jgi:hypothetical protein
MSLNKVFPVLEMDMFREEIEEPRELGKGPQYGQHQ